MAIMMSMVDRDASGQVSIAEARDNLPGLVHEVEKGRAVELTRRGRKVAVLISAVEYDRLRARRADLWESIQAYRAAHDLKELRMAEAFRGVRDRGRGRKHVW